MRIELYTKDKKGDIESVGASYIAAFPMVGATLNSDRGVQWQIVEYAMEYDRHKNFVGCSAEVKLSPLAKRLKKASIIK